jgi:hypothetical protein
MKVLSNESGVITLVIKNQNEISNRKYQVIPEIVVKDQNVNFSHLHGKQYRINSAFQKIQTEKEKQNKARNSIDQEETSDIEIDTAFYQYFATRALEVEDAEVNDLQPKVLPKYCRPAPGTVNKPACYSCDQRCSFTIDQVLNPTKNISKDDILEELHIHGHPKSRMMESTGLNNKRLPRNVKEAAGELADHYIYAHNQTEPFFL